MSYDHQLFKYSIKCYTTDEAVLHCLRALCQYAEESAKKQIGWGGTKKTTWKTQGCTFTVRFTSPKYRDIFVKEANKLLPGLWKEIERNDNDPATPQRR